MLSCHLPKLVGPLNTAASPESTSNHCTAVTELTASRHFRKFLCTKPEVHRTYRIIMTGYLTIIGLVCIQILRVTAVDDQVDKKLWLMDSFEDYKHPGSSRIERSDQLETVGDVVMNEHGAYPKIIRRGFAGEEFFLKASKSVPRIGRRNNDIKESPKRSLNKDHVNAVENWLSSHQTGDVNDSAGKHDFELPYGCQQLDAKTIFLVDLNNFVCNDQFYCCAPAKRAIANSRNANYL
ncbi:Hypothetical protein CINCED_3A001041 [Cinara cedri]|uniref:Uncharacterized protein n=1 Tax=Cinara cedri TaxID=506608 RepID=A0A5E4NCP2_9HEMI|nr:Hypothetical protein CINCED_3A001041 [Cinara cedri]